MIDFLIVELFGCIECFGMCGGYDVELEFVVWV